VIEGLVVVERVKSRRWAGFSANETGRWGNDASIRGVIPEDAGEGEDALRCLEK